MSAKFQLGYALSPILGILAVALGISQKRHAAEIYDSFLVTPAQTIDWLNTWARSNGNVARLLPKPEIALPATLERSVQNTDVTNC